jgi:hypothetical protein
VPQIKPQRHPLLSVFKQKGKHLHRQFRPAPPEGADSFYKERIPVSLIELGTFRVKGKGKFEKSERCCGVPRLEVGGGKKPQSVKGTAVEVDAFFERPYRGGISSRGKIGAAEKKPSAAVIGAEADIYFQVLDCPGVVTFGVPGTAQIEKYRRVCFAGSGGEGFKNTYRLPVVPALSRRDGFP